jgi:hypothetical protein
LYRACETGTAAGTMHSRTGTILMAAMCNLALVLGNNQYQVLGVRGKEVGHYIYESSKDGAANAGYGLGWVGAFALTFAWTGLWLSWWGCYAYRPCKSKRSARVAPAPFQLH